MKDHTIIHYNLDIEKLLKAQDNFSKEKEREDEDYRLQGIENRKRLLKFVLPFMHGVFALHNHKCKRDNGYSTNCRGLLGINKVDIEAKLDSIVENNFHWSSNSQVFSYNTSYGSIRIWLNSNGAHVNTHKLEYSMTSICGETYANSLEDELNDIAKLCGRRFTDEWL